jgi:hypothetical protein
MKKFRNFISEEMSVTLKQHGSTSYKVHSVGSKMKSHGGLKVGETVHDHHIDDMRDSGIKVRYHKEEVANEAIERRADRKTIIATDPATGRKVVKIAPKKEIDIGKGKMESVEVTEDYGAMKDAQAHAKKDGANYDRDVSVQHKYDAYHMKKRGYTHRKYNAYGSYEYNKHGSGNKITSADHSGVSEANVQELKIDTMQKYKKKAYGDIQTGENARHKGYPEKDIDKKQNKRYKGIDTANKRIAKKQVKMAKGIAFDKRYKGGNMTGASKAIDKIKPGLSDHPRVKSALRRANEEFNKGE